MTNTPNRLINEKSPYLRQHAHNPVDWRPWGEEAFSRARAENKPIFLSIGYSACHWCHVMERESFENPETALFLNQHFISIKVDREERPDIDAIYMHAVQMLTGSGGWPMSVFLTPDRLPFYGGTYFPPEDRYGMPGFRRVLAALASAWEDHPDQVQTSARDITRALQQALSKTPSAPAANNALPPAHLLTHAAQSALAAVDPRHGGFGNAPKFPPPGMLQLLIEAYRQTRHLSLLEPVALTLRQMARGGIFDQIGGGFHRYSVDATWLVPHFEKMLYDNAQMAFVYMEAYQLTGEAAFKETATQTLNYLLRDMLRSDGLFCASEDADSEGEEGRYYLWTQTEIEAALSAEDAAAAIHGFGIAPEGNFPSPDPQHAGQNILHLANTIPRDCLARIQPPLLAQRATRPRPLRNETPITAWNALTIQALAFAGRVLDNPAYRIAALRAADALRKQIAPDGTLPHTLDERPERIAGFLDDYALTLLTMLDVYMLSFDPSWIDTACSLAETMHQRFWDAEEGAYFSTESRHGQLPARAKTALDNVTPAGNSAAALALARLSILTHRTTYQDHARTIIHTFRALVEQTPLAAPTLLLAANALANTPWEIAIIGDPSLPAAQDLMKTAWRQAPPSSVIACGQPGEPTLPMLEGKIPVQGKPAAYCCHQSTCLPPTTDPAELDRLLRPPIPA